MESQFEAAKRALEDILNREWNSRSFTRDRYLELLRTEYIHDTNEEQDIKLNETLKELAEYKYFLRKDMPEIIAVGTRQIVLKLGHGYVGKTQVKREKVPNHYVASIFVYDPALGKEVEILKELGFEVPEHHYVGLEFTNGVFKVKDSGNGFVITPDSTEDGKYRVKDVKDEHFEELVNGVELKEQFTSATKTLEDIYYGRNPLYGMSINRHLEKGPEDAIKHMFFTQIDTTANTGKLVLGDLDHVILRVKPKPVQE